MVKPRTLAWEAGQTTVAVELSLITETCIPTPWP